MLDYPSYKISAIFVTGRRVSPSVKGIYIK